MKKLPLLAAICLGSALAPAQAGYLAGSVLVMKDFPGDSKYGPAVDNNQCYAAGISSDTPDQMNGPPCKTLTYACGLAQTNPGGGGVGGAAGWRIFLRGYTATSANPIIYSEDVVCNMNGTDATHFAQIQGEDAATQLHSATANHAAIHFGTWVSGVTTLTASHIQFGKMNVNGSTGRGVEVIGTATNHISDFSLFYNTSVYANTAEGAYFQYVDGLTWESSPIFNNNTGGGPCITLDHDTTVLFNADSVYRCGSTSGVPATPTNGFNITNSGGGTLATGVQLTNLHSNQGTVAKDANFSTSTYATVSGNPTWYDCDVDTTANLNTFSLSPSGVCTSP